ncbi:MAG: cyclic lactone autoinducer peptide [Peptococcaceae bacterium]|jgi:cyclic lactone autoinducer peptide|nr:cyclic lactone autoinducer peptide [Peptococcaceae bacterium]NLM22150.1 cyclic lactone autoinducer peptide [Peptococcaceae bacterium]
MKARKKAAPSLLLSVLGLIGTLGIITPNCLGWFYEPKKPEGII